MSIKKRLLIVILFGMALYGALWIGYNANQSSVTQLRPAVATPSVAVTYPAASELFTLVNTERVQLGLPTLVEDTRLNASATAKCADMVTKNYWSHNDPAGLEPWHFLVDQGISYKLAAENLAYGQQTSDQVVREWMASPGHRNNIVNPNYTHVGYAVCHSPNFVAHGAQDIIVQHFDLPL